jgi:hypothetical protein
MKQSSPMDACMYQLSMLEASSQIGIRRTKSCSGRLNLLELSAELSRTALAAARRQAGAGLQRASLAFAWFVAGVSYARSHRFVAPGLLLAGSTRQRKRDDCWLCPRYTHMNIMEKVRNTDFSQHTHLCFFPCIPHSSTHKLITEI